MRLAFVHFPRAVGFVRKHAHLDLARPARLTEVEIWLYSHCVRNLS